MKIFTTILALSVGGFAACANPADISKCGGFRSYGASGYLDVANALQAQPRAIAIKQLEDWAKTGKYNDQIIILCRMLFEAKPHGEFRRPMLGGFMFYGNTSEKDWPLEPITIVDDVPLKIVSGYFLAGQAESGSAYLAYCLKNTDWTNRRYQPSDEADIESALDKLLSSSIWKRPLNRDEVSNLTEQIQK
jgi:hypothetical protein